MKSPAQPAGQRPSPGAWLWPLVWILSGLLIGGLVALYLRRPEPASIVVQPPPTPQPTHTPGPITVYVSGAVHTPGLYTLPLGARVHDAVDMAGGFTPDAQGDLLNMADILFDGAQVHVPASGDAQQPALAPRAGVSGEDRTLVSLPETTGRINLNTASQAELEELPGVGPTKAQAIIAHRPYDSVDDLDRVPGFGPKTMEELRPLVTVE